MKRFSTLLTAAAVFFSVQSNAQSIDEKFNSSTAINTLSNSTNCWKFSNFTADNSAVRIEGTYSVASKNLGISTISTPYFDFTQPVTVNFRYRLSEKLNGQAQRILRIGTTDVNGNFTALPASTVTLNASNSGGTGNSAPGIQQFTANNVSVSGTRRFTIQVDALQGDGQAYVLIDEVTITGTNVYHYGATPWNSAPTAVDDFFSSFGTNPVSGSVITNDTDPNIDLGESVTGAVLVSGPSAPGTLVLNANGTFTFTPDPVLFTGGQVTFTYRAVDNGYDPLQSAATATVVLDYPELAPLPVKLMSFAGSAANNKAQLRWSVADNETGDKFQVLRSDDGNHFTEVGTVFINNRVGAESYTFADSKELDAVTYYKLKIINKDRSVSYSNVIALKSTAAAKTAAGIHILQNPVASTLTFTYSATTATQGQLAIYNTLGVKVYSSRLSSQKGTNSVSLTLEGHLAAGTYILEVVNGTDRATTRMIKR